MPDSRTPDAPQPLIPMIAGAIVGDVLVVAGVAWFLWRSAVRACVERGGEVSGAACDAGGALQPLQDLLPQPITYFVVGAVIVSLLGSFAFITRAAKRAAESLERR